MSKQPSEESPPVFADFLKLWKSDSQVDELKAYSRYVRSNPLIDNVLSLGPCFVYMLNYSTMKYLYISPSVTNILGYDVKEFREGGPAFIIPRTHPDDVKELMDNLFPQMLDYYYSTPIEDRKKIRCTYDYRLKRIDGKYVRVMQQTLVVEIDEEGRPLVDIGIISDISQYKKENKINLSLTKYDQEAGFVTVSPIENPEVKDRISGREVEILKLLMQGYSSKKIADELHISVNTVRNHRQNLLEKTRTKNIAELITFALSNSLI